jgi:hypothetical protein
MYDNYTGFPDQYEEMYYIDKVQEGKLEPGADPKQSKYTDDRGLPIAPRSYKDLFTRRKDPSVDMWVNAGEKEWSGLVGRNCLGMLTRYLQLRARTRRSS